MLKFIPPIIAHRGASAYAPENTIPAFQKAKELGVQWVEFDVTLTSCGEVIVIHDDTLERTTNGQGNVAESDLNYLQSLDAGIWFSADFTGTKLPLLSEVLSYLQKINLYANIELKWIPNREEELVSAVLNEVDKINSSYKSLLFSSFSVEILKLLRGLRPHIQLGYALHEWTKNWLEEFHTLNCQTLSINHYIMTEYESNIFEEQNIAWLAYTVNDQHRATELFSWGASALFSDCPDKIMLESIKF